MSLFEFDFNGNSGSYCESQCGNKEAALHSKRERNDVLQSDEDICDGILMFQTEQDHIGSYPNDKWIIYEAEKVAESLTLQGSEEKQ